MGLGFFDIHQGFTGVNIIIYYEINFILHELQEFMYLFPHFFYNSDGGEGGSNAGGDGGNGNTDVVIPENIQKELEELRAYKQSILEKEPTKTPEQIAKEAEIEKVNFRKYSVENDLMKDDDFNAFDTLSKKQSRDLVYEKFAKEQLEDNPEITDDEIKDAFESEYKLNELNEKAKARGLARLEKEASEIKNPIETAYKNAKTRYDEDKSISAQAPAFKKFIDNLIAENTPDKLTLGKTKDGEEEVSIEVELTKADREELAKTFTSAKAFRAFLDGKDKPEEVKANLVKKINGFLKQKYFDTALSKSFETGHGRGVKKGSNVGANNPFALQKQQGQDHGNAKTSMQEVNESHASVSSKINFRN